MKPSGALLFPNATDTPSTWVGSAQSSLNMAASPAPLLRLRVLKLLPAAASWPRFSPGWAEVPGEGPSWRACADAVWAELILRGACHMSRAPAPLPLLPAGLCEWSSAGYVGRSLYSLCATPEPTERAAHRRWPRAPPRRTSVTGKGKWASLFPNRSFPGRRPPAHPRSPLVQRAGESARLPPRSPELASPVWPPVKEVDRLVPASVGRHLPGSPALLSGQGPQAARSFLAKGRQARPALKSGSSAAYDACPEDRVGWRSLKKRAAEAGFCLLLLWIHQGFRVGLSEVQSRRSGQRSWCVCIFPFAAQSA